MDTRPALQRRRWLFMAALSVFISLTPRPCLAEDVPTIKVPHPPPGVYRDPDWKRDFPGYRAIAHGWLSDDGRTFWCIADRGEPISFGAVMRGEKAERDPVFLELDLVIKSVVREIDLPADGVWVRQYGWRDDSVVYLPQTDRLVGWRLVRETIKPVAPPGEFVAMGGAGWELHSLDLKDPQNPTTRFYPYPQQPRGKGHWQWAFSADGRWLWRLVYEPKHVSPRLEKLSVETLKTAHEVEPAWDVPVRHAAGSSDPFNRMAWRIDESKNELWFAVQEKQTDQTALKWVRFNLQNGLQVHNTTLYEGNDLTRDVSFSSGGGYLAALTPTSEDSPYRGPMRYWQLPEGDAAFVVDTRGAGLLSAGPLLGDDRYLVSTGFLDPNDERVAWRYDRERGAWSWPRKIVVPQGTTHRRFSADGSTFVTFNLVDGLKNRLAVYRLGDDERYDEILAERISRQRPKPLGPRPLPEAEHTLKVLPGGDEVVVERRALSVPDGNVLQAHASADGKRVVLWMMHDDRRPEGNAWIREPIDPNTGLYDAVVIDAESADVVQTAAHPTGYTPMELGRHVQVALSRDGRWLLMSFAKETGKRLSMEQPIVGPCRLQVFEVETGEVVSGRELPGEYRMRPLVYVLEQGILLRSFAVNPLGTTRFEFCKLPSLEVEAEIETVWPNTYQSDNTETAAVMNVRYDREGNRFIAIMREATGTYNGRQAPANSWVQYLDAKTKKPLGQGPVFEGAYGIHGPSLHDGLIRVGYYDHPALGSLIDIYRYDSDRPMLRIDGSVYEHGVFGGFVGCGPWLLLQPGSSVNGKPGIMLVNAETRQVLGPVPIHHDRQILWISGDGRRILIKSDRAHLQRGDHDTAPVLEWLTLRE